jgi:poly-gamma-glutamate synthesis protein (capsule biosynthesis protein)
LFPSLLLLGILSAAPAQADRCAERVTLAFGGDVILHRSLQRQVKAEGYGPLLDGLKPLLESADLTFVNLEGPIAPGIARDGSPSMINGEPAGFPRFNFPASLAAALKGAGVDVVQTANNHVLDRGWRGVDATLEHVEAAGLVAVGTRRSGERGGFRKLFRVGGLKVAYLSCTFWANGKKDKKRQVQFCNHASKKKLLAEVRAARSEADAVIVGVHWGIEDAERPGGSQIRFGKRLIDAGADAVIGTHPHVLHNVRRTKARRREGVVAYSLGNLVSAQLSKAHRTGAVLYLDLAKGGDGVVVEDTRVVNTLVRRRPGRRASVGPLRASAKIKPVTPCRLARAGEEKSP